MAKIDQVSKAFEPNEAESRIYENWLAHKYFAANVNMQKKPYTIMMPPPNITGQLHMGHALDNTLQDTLTRWRRMQGYEALWLPGIDHASIATEAKIVDAMAREGISKEDLGRDRFLEKAWEWKDKYGKRIMEQLQRMGSSCDWDRTRFTMDEGLSKAVTTVFVNLYNKGLIYRGERLINWCPHCKTSISDIEVIYEERQSSLWHIRYPLTDGTSHLVVATTRPETMLGDTAVAVHPDDERYTKLVGKTVILPLRNIEIPIVADDYVESDFGTGVVKITPAHDPNDFELGKRHDLPVVDMMTDDAHIAGGFGVYSGMTREEARKAIVKDLEEAGLIEKIEAYKHSVGTCQRCKTIVEPKLSTQWFVSMSELAEPAVKCVEDSQVRFIPDRFEKIYFNWMNNVRDWNISRQLWWGHRIPAYYCDDCGEVIVAKEEPDSCSNCGCKSLHQDEDTLDTWFSSALWPFSTLGWPEETADFDYFYPTDVLVTGYDIIFFWVARMIFSAIEHTGEVPFHTVFMHGIVRDAEGRKMSKSLDNGVDPLEVIEKAGADALRYSLIMGTGPGSDQRFSDQVVDSGRSFVNKIWNAFRFVLMNLPDDIDFQDVDEKNFQPEDRWILARLNQVTKELTQNLEKFELGVAMSKIYEFIWEEYCDWYIEMVKPRLYGENTESGLEARYVLVSVMRRAMQLLHPFMPFVTEEIYMNLPATKAAPAAASIMISQWPDRRPEWKNEAVVRQMELVMDATRQIRNIRVQMNVAPSRKVGLIVVTGDDAIAALFESGKAYLNRLAGIESIDIRGTKEGIASNAVTAVVPGADLFIPLADLVDLDKERERIRQALAKAEDEITRVENKLKNVSFVSRAPESVVAKEQDKLASHQKVRDQLAARLLELDEA